MDLKKPIVTWALLASLTPLLGGCFTAAVVGMGAGVMMATDRRTSDTQVADEAIELRSGNRVSEKFGDKVHVNATSYNRTVLLTGEVPDAATRTEVEKLVDGVPNVKAVANELQVSGISSLAARSSDVYLTSKVKARFVDTGKFSANHVKVVSESGTVYLMGIVTQTESDAASEIARTTGGVLKVVRLFEIQSDDDIRRLDNRPANATQPAAAR
jgi:osmotically-inducible protein OsmY